MKIIFFILRILKKCRNALEYDLGSTSERSYFFISNFVDRIERIMTVCPLTIVIFHDFSIISAFFSDFIFIYLFFDFDI